MEGQRQLRKKCTQTSASEEMEKWCSKVLNKREGERERDKEIHCEGDKDRKWRRK